ncbi:MAG TPA: hypothetical protein VG077_10275 [Verrucomicrobiae bacterium]|nr:hypothetical protein [Verrucomicrobiae bacterium]
MKKFRIVFMVFVAVAILLPANAQPSERIVVEASAHSTPFPHFWEEMFGSGRAILSLRSSYRGDLRAVKQVTGFQYVRFHGILLDEVGVYQLNKQHQPDYNFTYGTPAPVVLPG